MESQIIVKKLRRNGQNEEDEYNDNPEKCLGIVEILRKEAENFIYGNTTTFQSVITVIRKK